MTHDNDLYASIENDSKQPNSELEKITDHEFEIDGIKFIADYNVITYPDELRNSEYEIIELHKEDENGDLEKATKKEIRMVEKWLGQ